jgi:hypothetical protein
MIAHTPGTWALSDFSRDMIIDSNGDLISLIIDGKSDETKLANACLIAAAPDLLEALRSLMDDIDNYGIASHFSKNMAREAITKASGEAE